MQTKLDAAKAVAPCVPVHPYSASYKRTVINKIIGAADGGLSLAGVTITAGGWVKSGRAGGGGAFAFISLNDGSCFDDLQVRVTGRRSSAAICQQRESTAGLCLEGGAAVHMQYVCS